MYYFIRFVLFIITLFFLILCLKNICVEKKKVLKILFWGMFLIINIGLNFLPVENLFYTFKTPEDAFRYTHKSDAEVLVYGKESVFAMGIGDDETTNITLMKKVDNGWKIGYHKHRVVKMGHYNNFSFFIHRYGKSNDFYINVETNDRKINVITDSKNSQFLRTNYASNEINNNSVEFYAYIGNFNESYYIIVDGEKISFSDIQWSNLHI